MTSAAIERRLNFTQTILIILMVTVVAVPFLVTLWISHQYPSVSTIRITDLAVVGDSALCPGDVLVYKYDLHMLGSGVLIHDRTIWQVTPPRTLVFSDARRFILTDAIDQPLTEAWHVPAKYVNPATDMSDRLPPGKYSLRLAVSSHSRSTVVDISSVDFSIRPDCNE